MKLTFLLIGLLLFFCLVLGVGGRDDVRTTNSSRTNYSLILQVRSNEIYKLGYCSSLTDIREMSQGYSQIRFLSSFFSFWLQGLVEQNIIMMDFGQFA